MIKISSVVVLSFLLVACSSEEETSGWNQSESEETVEYKMDSIDTRFYDVTDFENDTLQDLLLELGMCIQSDSFSIERPPCEPNYFKFYKFDEDMSWNDGFMIETRAGVGGVPIRTLLVYERVGEGLVLANGWTGRLVKTETPPSGRKNLWVLFPDAEAVSFTISMEWQDKKYMFNKVEEINGFPVKESLKDSVSEVVEKRLSKMFF